jgi:HD-like signal output (HDOD) protein
MGEFVRDSLAKISNLVATGGKSFLEAEKEILGIDHAELGGRIAQHWNFPVEISEAIAFHHRPDLLEKEEKIMPWIVYVADQACLMMGVGGGVDGLAHRAVSQVLKKFNLRMKDMEMSMVLLSEDLNHAKELISII